MVPVTRHTWPRYVQAHPTVALATITNAPSNLFGPPPLFRFIQQQQQQQQQQQKLSTGLLNAT
jgi:hypothetical protein